MDPSSSPSRTDRASTPVARSSLNFAAAPSTPSRSPHKYAADCSNLLNLTASPGSNMAPFDPVSSERLNKQLGLQASASVSERRDSNASVHSLVSPSRQGHSRDSSVHDKISQFNTLAAVQSPARHDRKTADAALKRAVLGREEAEAEVRRYRDDVRTLKKQVEEGKERERKVGERLESVMVCQAPPCANC